MKIYRLLFFGIALSFSLAMQAQKALPSVEVKTLDGKAINIQDYANNGKVTVLSFWATWCSPCKKELDAIAELYPDWRDEHGIEMVAVTIDTRRALAKVKPMVQQKGWEYEILSDVNGDLKNALNFQTIPQTLVLDKDGNIVYTHSGYVPGDEYELEEKLLDLAK